MLHTDGEKQANWTTNSYCVSVFSVFSDCLAAAHLSSFLFRLQSSWWSGIREEMALLLPCLVPFSALPFFSLICGKRTEKCHREGVASACNRSLLSDNPRCSETNLDLAGASSNGARLRVVQNVFRRTETLQFKLCRTNLEKWREFAVKLVCNSLGG